MDISSSTIILSAIFITLVLAPVVGYVVGKYILDHDKP